MDTASTFTDRMVGPAWKATADMGDIVYANGHVTHYAINNDVTYCGKPIVGVYANQDTKASCRTCTHRRRSSR